MEGKIDWRPVKETHDYYFMPIKMANGRTLFVNFDRPVHLFAGEDVMVKWSEKAGPQPKFTKSAIDGSFLWCGIVPPFIEVEISVWTVSRKQKTFYRYGCLEFSSRTSMEDL